MQNSASQNTYDQENTELHVELYAIQPCQMQRVRLPARGLHDLGWSSALRALHHGDHFRLLIVARNAEEGGTVIWRIG
jgi:hypothetical protein